MATQPGSVLALQHTAHEALDKNETGQAQLFRRAKRKSSSMTANSQFGKAKCEVEHIILVIAGFLEGVENVTFEVNVACGAGQASFAGSLKIDMVSMGDFQQRFAQRGFDGTIVAVAIDKDNCHGCALVHL